MCFGCGTWWDLNVRTEKGECRSLIRRGRGVWGSVCGSSTGNGCTTCLIVCESSTENGYSICSIVCGGSTKNGCAISPGQNERFLNGVLSIHNSA